MAKRNDDGPGAGVEIDAAGVRVGSGQARFGDCFECGRLSWTRPLDGVERCQECEADYKAARGADGE